VTVDWKVTGDGAKEGVDYEIEGAADRKTTIAKGKQTATITLKRKPRGDLPPDGRAVKVTCSAAKVDGPKDPLEVTLPEDDSGRDLLVIVLATEDKKSADVAKDGQLKAFAKKYARRLVGGGVFVAGADDKWGLAGSDDFKVIKGLPINEVCSIGFGAVEEIHERTKKRNNDKEVTTFLLWYSDDRPVPQKDKAKNQHPKDKEIYFAWVGADKDSNDDLDPGDKDKRIFPARTKRDVPAILFVQPNEVGDKLESILK